MQVTVHKAFDLVVAITKLTQGETFVLDPVVDNIFQAGPNFGFVWYNTVGNDVLTNTVTGEQIARSAGTCTLTEPIPTGEWRTEVAEDLEVLCVSSFMNQNKLPIHAYLTQFKLLSQNQLTVPHGTKLFLGHGSLVIEGKTITGPQQILFKSGDKQVTASTNCYGFYVT